MNRTKHKTQAGGRECRCKKTHKNTGRWEGVEPFSQLNNTRGSGDVQSRMWDGMSSGVPMGIRRRAYPSLLTGPSPSCSHASCKASTHSCSKRLRITMLQADDSSYNSNSVITQSGRDMGCCVILSIIPRERCLHNETIWSPTASYFVSRRYYP